LNLLLVSDCNKLILSCAEFLVECIVNYNVYLPCLYFSSMHILYRVSTTLSEYLINMFYRSMYIVLSEFVSCIILLVTQNLIGSFDFSEVFLYLIM
jgi:hypothetical protein